MIIEHKRKIKVYFNKRKYKGNCPHCEEVIEYHVTIFSVENDDGEMVCTCDACGEEISIPCLNPEDSYIISGATKDYALDYSYEAPSYLTEIYTMFEYNGDIFKDAPSYNSNTISLYSCETCDDNLELIAHQEIYEKFNKFASAINDYTIIDIKGYGFLPEKVLVAINFKCSCRTEHKALFYKDYNHCGFSSDDFLLANITNTQDLNDKIDGTLTKSDSLEILKKIIVRWELVFDKTYLIFPYVGYYKSPADKTLKLWREILSQSHSPKLSIVTKTQTLNSFKKAVTTEYLDYKTLERFDFTPKAITSAIKNTNSHAKIYCGVSEDYVESISGSANIAQGPSAEQLTFKRYYSYSDFHRRYLAPFNLKEIPEDLFPLKSTHDCHVLFDEDNNFKSQRLYKKQLSQLLD